MSGRRHLWKYLSPSSCLLPSSSAQLPFLIQLWFLLLRASGGAEVKHLQCVGDTWFRSTWVGKIPMEKCDHIEVFLRKQKERFWVTPNPWSQRVGHDWWLHSLLLQSKKKTVCENQTGSVEMMENYRSHIFLDLIQPRSIPHILKIAVKAREIPAITPYKSIHSSFQRKSYDIPPYQLFAGETE